MGLATLMMFGLPWLALAGEAAGHPGAGAAVGLCRDNAEPSWDWIEANLEFLWPADASRPGRDLAPLAKKMIAETSPDGQKTRTYLLRSTSGEEIAEARRLHYRDHAQERYYQRHWRVHPPSLRISRAPAAGRLLADPDLQD
jgi:hypothetical protein